MLRALRLHAKLFIAVLMLACIVSASARHVSASQPFTQHVPKKDTKRRSNGQQPSGLDLIEAWNAGPSGDDAHNKRVTQAAAAAAAATAAASAAVTAAVQAASSPPAYVKVVLTELLHGNHDGHTQSASKGTYDPASSSQGASTNGCRRSRHKRCRTSRNGSIDAKAGAAAAVTTAEGRLHAAAGPQATSVNAHSNSSTSSSHLNATGKHSTRPDNTSKAGSDSRVQQQQLPLPGDSATKVAAVGVPERCIVAGSALFSSCAVEIYSAQAHFNLTLPYWAPQNYTELLRERGVTREQLLQYLQVSLAAPSKECCAAHCCFNQLLLCDCEPSVLQVVVRFAGVDEPFYALLVAELAESCGISHFYGSSCPLRLLPSSTASTCTAGVRWPPLQPQAHDTLEPAGTTDAAGAAHATDHPAGASEQSQPADGPADNPATQPLCLAKALHNASAVRPPSPAAAATTTIG